MFYRAPLSFITNHRALNSLSLSLAPHPPSLLFGTVSYSSQQIRHSLSSIGLWALKREFHYEPSASSRDFSAPRHLSAARQLESTTATGYPLFNLKLLALFCHPQSPLASARNLEAAFAFPSLCLLRQIPVLQSHLQVAVSEERDCVGEDCSEFES